MRTDQIVAKILQALWNVLFFKEQVIWESPFSVEESASRLAMAVKGSGFLSIFNRPTTETVAGRVSRDRVLLYKKNPMSENAFKPVFRGHFLLREGRTTLEGFFSLARDVQAFMIVWFACPVLAMLGAGFTDCLKRFQKGATVLDAILPMVSAILVSLVWFLFGAGVTALFKYSSNQDSTFIIEFVRKVFEKTGDQGGRPG